jgi:hypothetical protein
VSYKLSEHGDAVEQEYLELFLRDEFPSYETFWADSIVPLTLRPESPAFKSDEGLAKIGRGPEDVCNAQLHYTTFTHLVRVFDLRQDGFSLADTFTEALVRLAAATDVADELIERVTNPGQYEPWDEASGRRARDAWRSDHGAPTWDLRKYRNRLLHGGLVPFAMQGTEIEGGVLVPREKPVLRFPKIGREADFLDWRQLVGPDQKPLALIEDLDTAENIVDEAWTSTLTYLENEWKANLTS